MAARSADSRRAECLGFVDGVLALADSADDDVACLLGKAAAAAIAEKQAAVKAEAEAMAVRVRAEKDVPVPVPVVECYATPNYHRSLTTSRYSTVCYLETLSDTSDLSDTSEILRGHLGVLWGYRPAHDVRMAHEISLVISISP